MSCKFIMTAVLAGLTLSLSGVGRGEAQNGPALVYPDDSYSRPREDHSNLFETQAGLVIAGVGVKDEAANLNQFKMDLAEGEGQSWTRLVFNRKATATLPVGLSLGRTWLRRRAESVSFTVRNPSAKPVAFMLHVTDIAWQPVREPKSDTWIMRSAPIGPGEEKRITLALDQLACASNPALKAMRFPATMTLFVDQFENETNYEIWLRDLTVGYPDAVDLAVTALDVPAEVTAGQPLAVRVSATGKIEGRAIDLELHRPADCTLWRARLSADELKALAQNGECIVKRTAPWYVGAGEATLGVVADGYRVPRDEAKVKIINNTKPELARAERRVDHGRPSVFVNDKPFDWSSYACYDWQPGNVADFGASGATMLIVPTTAGAHVHNICRPTWTGPDTYDFSEIEEQVGMALGANPAAMLVLRVSLNPPPFWFQQHAAEGVQALIRTPAGDLPWRETGSQSISLASESWKKDQAEALRKLIDYCKVQPWSTRVIGFMPTGEVTEEWFAWGCNDGFYGDYSPANQAGFKRWCAAAKLPYTEIPSPDSRKMEGYDIYPADNAGTFETNNLKADGPWSAAYTQYNNALSAETLRYFASVIKQATGGRSLVGTFYGYIVQLAGEPRQNLSGQFGLRALLDDPNVDFFGGIPLHNFRSLQGGQSALVSATESIMAAGKLNYNENDLFSWLHNAIWHIDYNPQNPREGAIFMHRRVLADDLVHGTVLGWFSLLASWHHDAALQAEFAQQMKLHKEALSCDRASADEVALVIDDSSFNWVTPGTTLLHQTTIKLLEQLGLTGAPVGVWLLSDVDKLPARIKMVVVTSAFAPRTEDLKKLEGLIAKGRRTIVVAGSVGLVNTDTRQWDTGATARLVGLPVRIEDRMASGTAVLVDGGAPVSDLARMRPRPYLDGAGFMKFTDDGKMAGAERELAGGGRLIWCAVAPADCALLRQWEERAGVHCYAPAGCSVHASRELVSITAPTAGDIEIKWPSAVRARDLFDGWTGQGSAMKSPFAAGQTRLFRLSAQ